MARFWNAGEDGMGYWDEDNVDVINPWEADKSPTPMGFYGSSVSEQVLSLDAPLNPPTPQVVRADLSLKRHTNRKLRAAAPVTPFYPDRIKPTVDSRTPPNQASHFAGPQVFFDIWGPGESSGESSVDGDGDGQGDPWYSDAWDWTKDNFLFGTPLDSGLGKIRADVREAAPNVAGGLTMIAMLVIMFAIDTR